MLTGKTKEDFDKWMYDEYYKDCISQPACRMNWAETFSPIVLNSYIIEWLDEVKITVQIKTKFGQKRQKQIFWFHVNNIKSEMYESRQEAQRYAILTANGIYNKRL